MGRGKRHGSGAASRSEPAPRVLPGDFVEVLAADTLIPIDGAVAEVNAVYSGGAELSIIAGGRAVMTLDWTAGDRWQKTLPPVDLPPSYIRSSAAPSNGLKTAHSWRDRPAPRHPLVAELGSDFDGWIRVAGDKRLIEVVDSAWYQSYEYGETDGWEENMGGDTAGLDRDALEQAVRLGALIAEADCMNSGFVLHSFFPDLELRVHGEDDLKGLEAVVEGFEALGLEVSARNGYES